MVGSSWFGGRRATAAGAGVVLALVAGSLSAPAVAAPVPGRAPVECPTAVPRSAVAAGLVGEGLTVVTGTEPQPFKVEVLGVLTNGIGAGRDLIMIKVSDLPGREVVSQGGGIWAGMSGSPVYVDGRLLGAVSYGFSSSPSAIGGLTPAADMFDVLDLGRGARATSTLGRPAGEVRLPAARLKSLAAQAGTAVPRGSLAPLVTPLGVSGLASKRLGLLQDQMDRAGRNVHVYAAGSGGSAAPAAAPAARPVAGGNFAAVLSTGDVAAYGVGTTTAVCGDRAVAFGHPLNMAGPSSYGAADADSVAIIEDKTFGSFKMANLGPSVGTVDQDRTAAIRADLTRTPPATDITTVIRSADTGKSRTGSTQVYDPASLAGLSIDAVWAGQDAVFDEWNDGTASSAWTIKGRRAGGKAFSLTRTNLWASQEDSTLDPAFDLAYATDQVVDNDYEKVTVDAIEFRSQLATTYNQLHITKMEVAVNKGKFSTPRRLTLKAGDKVRVRISTAPYRSTKAATTTLPTMTVPRAARGRSGALLAIGGVDLAQSEGSASEECIFFGEGCEDVAAGSLDKLLTSIKTAPKNNALEAQLLLEDEDGEDTAVARSSTIKNLTVTGEREITVTVRR